MDANSPQWTPGMEQHHTSKNSNQLPVCPDWLTQEKSRWSKAMSRNRKQNFNLEELLLLLLLVLRINAAPVYETVAAIFSTMSPFLIKLVCRVFQTIGWQHAGIKFTLLHCSRALHFLRLLVHFCFSLFCSFLFFFFPPLSVWIYCLLHGSTEVARGKKRGE